LAGIATADVARIDQCCAGVNYERVAALASRSSVGIVGSIAAVAAVAGDSKNIPVAGTPARYLEHARNAPGTARPAVATRTARTAGTARPTFDLRLIGKGLAGKNLKSGSPVAARPAISGTSPRRTTCTTRTSTARKVEKSVRVSRAAISPSATAAGATAGTACASSATHIGCTGVENGAGIRGAVGRRTA
jgi:hypothetical protein